MALALASRVRALPEAGQGPIAAGGGGVALARVRVVIIRAPRRAATSVAGKVTEGSALPTRLEWAKR